MAIKKSELYSSLWASCDELRGGMDASQYKDYVLVLLFVKYVSDKYAGHPYAEITVPKGSSFQDMVALKGETDIGDQINKKILAPLYKANNLSDQPDFDDPSKLGGAKDRKEKIENLIAIFEDPRLDFSKNRADGDDIIGDAYEYLMRHFATESGKSKGQFYTPSEVSQVMAKILGIGKAKTSPSTTVYDPTCGSGSLILKVAEEATTKLSLYGQEKDSATSGLARMNMILHDNAGAVIRLENTLSNPQFLDGDSLKAFDFVVANPPFSDKRWSTGFDPANDPYQRFKGFGIPPKKQGDFAYLLHIIRSLNVTGRGACILPHGVLFRGNAEADIRRALIRKGYIRGIIGLPANLFYGTGIPACIVAVDKREARASKGVFMVDASQGFKKDGPKNRLRSQDIHKIVDVFTNQIKVEKYSRMVSVEEIEKKEFNLNLPRYIDSQVEEDIQDIDGHLNGGIPQRDIDALNRYWAVCPTLPNTLVRENRPGYVDLAVEKTDIKSAIYEHPEFVDYVADMNEHFASWRDKATIELKKIKPGCRPKEVIYELSEGLLEHYDGKPLIDAYDVYQHLMDYWDETMQDDLYIISAEGWEEGVRPREIHKVKNKNNKLVWAESHDYLQGKRRFRSDLVPGDILIGRFFQHEQTALDELKNDLAAVEQEMLEQREEHCVEGGLLEDVAEVNEDKSKITAKAIKDWLKENGDDPEYVEECAAVSNYSCLLTKQSQLKSEIKTATNELYDAISAKYNELNESEVKALVVDDKWMANFDSDVHGELDRTSSWLSHRVVELTDRYEASLPKLASRLSKLEVKTEKHLRKMGIRWD